MKIINKITLCLILITIMASFTACAKEDNVSLDELNPAVFEHPSGYSISLPAEWQICNSESGGAYAVSSNNEVVVNIYPEIGGMDYHSLADQQQIIQEMLGEFLTEVELVKEMSFGLGDEGCRMLFCATNEKKQKWNTEAVYLAPFNGIHYYLFMSTPDKLYTNYSGLFAQISDSFKVSLTEDQAYALFNLDEDQFAEKMSEGLIMQGSSPTKSLIENQENS